MPLKNDGWDGTWLRIRLEDLGLTQKQFAERIRVNRNTVNRWAQDKIPLPNYAVAFILLLEENQSLTERALSLTTRLQLSAAGQATHHP